MTSNIPESKVCNNCGIEKPLEEFYIQKTNMFDGRQNYCKTCMRAKQAEMKVTKPGYTHETREKPLKKQWPIDLWHYTRLLEAQGGRCAICLCPPPENKKFKPNYNHKDGSIRGLLCEACDHGLACFDDNIVQLTRGLEFLYNVDIAKGEK